MLRTILLILVAVSVIVMPSYAAIRCARACDIHAVGGDEVCCERATTSPYGQEQPDSSDRSGGGSHHCAVPCCGYVTYVPAEQVARAESPPLAQVLPMIALQHDSLTPQAIFHPPRA